MSVVELFDGVNFDYFGVDDNYSCNSLIDEAIWNDNTVLLAQFNDNKIDGSNFDGSFIDVTHFDVYRKFNNRLHKICTIPVDEPRYVEDLLSGDLRQNYLIHAVSTKTKATIDGSTWEDYNEDNKNNYISTRDNKCIQCVIESNPVNFDCNGIVSIVGLNQVDALKKEYTIDKSNIWNFALNIKNDGTALTMDKTFTDTQHRFPILSVGNRRYNTATVTALIGDIVCPSGTYEDSNELLEQWEEFAASPTLKIFKDKRGRMFLCDIESTNVTYMDALGFPAEITFSIREIEAIENIKINGIALSYNPTVYIPLCDSNNLVLADTNEALLFTPKGR